jgi:SAM-dependent methyltransferase
VSVPDTFEDLARYYDPLMSHVNYGRWFTTVLTLGELLNRNPRHLDAACGTGTLAGMLRQAGWNSAGVDLSQGMVREARRKHADLPLAQADLRALPFHREFDLITCLFDSLNFLLDEADLALAFTALHGALRDGGILYADIITERMVTDHFEGQEWMESNDGFQSRWASSYDRKQGVAESRVQVNTGKVASIRERVYELPAVTGLMGQAGFDVLGAFDAESWKAPRKKTTRIDIVAVKNGAPGTEARFEKIVRTVRTLVYGG